MATIKHINKGIGRFVRQDGHRFYFIFEGSDREEYLTVGAKFNLDNIEVDDPTLLKAIMECMRPNDKAVRRHYLSIPISSGGYRRPIDDRMFLRVAGKLYKWEKGKRFRGNSYADMVNQVIGCNVSWFVAATYDLGAWIGGCEALFVFFDNSYRDNGSEGFYRNYFKNEDTSVEICDIRNLDEYVDVKRRAPIYRFVFKRDPDRTGDEYLCEFVGIFECVSKDVYEIIPEHPEYETKKRFEGELVYKRSEIFEKLWYKNVLRKDI